MASPTTMSDRWKIHHATQPSWPLAPPSAVPRRQREEEEELEPIRISVLDSSFNPPTCAHMAMMSQPFLSPQYPCDALLLLFSTTNADKGTTTDTPASHIHSSSRPVVPTVSGRIELMCAAIDDWITSSTTTTTAAAAAATAATETSHSVPPGGIAVATSPLPYFADKSHEIVQSLSKTLHRPIKLTWFVGWDTLIRIFNPKYYDSPSPSQPAPEDAPYHHLTPLSTTMQSTLDQFLALDGDASQLLVFPRSLSSADPHADKIQKSAFLRRCDVASFVNTGQIKMVDFNPHYVNDSSTDIRNAVAQEQWQYVEQLTTPSVFNLIRQHHYYSAN